MLRMTWRTNQGTNLRRLVLTVGVVLSLDVAFGHLCVSSLIHAQEPSTKPAGVIPPRVQTAREATETPSQNSRPDRDSQPATTDSNARPTTAAPMSGQGSAPAAPKLTARQIEMLKQTPAEQQRIFQDATDRAALSIRTSKESFDRGLMPLSDFTDQSLAALEIQIAVADLRGDRRARVTALSDHFELMKTAAKQLQKFDQPGAEGWAADLAYINLLATNSELRLAVVRGDQGAYSRAAELGAKLAEEHYTQRLADFQTGHASLSQLARAASYLTTSSGLPGGVKGAIPGMGKFQEYMAALDDVVTQTQKFAEQGAGVGREDRLYHAQFELARAEGQAALMRRRPEAAIVAFDQAMDSAKAWYGAQVKFHETGTASLREITQAWWSRAELSDLTARSGFTPDDTAQKAQQADFEQILKLVSNTTDRQGRIEADIAYVQSLQALDELWTRQRAVQAMAAVKNATAVKPPVPRSGGRVIELKPQTGTNPTFNGIPGTTSINTGKSKSSKIEIVTPKRSTKP